MWPSLEVPVKTKLTPITINRNSLFFPYLSLVFWPLHSLYILLYSPLAYLFPQLLKSIIIPIIIIIIIMCRLHGYLWPSLATFPYRSSPLAGLQGYIPYPHIAAECMFVLVVLLLPSHMWGSIRVHHLWARPCFSSRWHLHTRRNPS